MSDLGEREIVRAYQAGYLELRARAATSVAALWQTYGGVAESDRATFAALAAEAVEATQAQMCNLMDGYFDALAREAGFPELAEAARINPSKHIGAAVRNGVPTTDVYGRPTITARAALAEGVPFDQAMAKAERRAVTAAETDIALTNRSSAQEAMENRRVRFYRRTLTGRSCVFCATASTQRYRRGDLMPLHARCDCGIAPIFGDGDPGRVLNQEILREIKRGDVPNYWNQKGFVEETDDGIVFEINGKRTVIQTKVVQHGELGPTLVDKRHNPTTPGQLPKQPATPGTKPTPARRGRAPTVDDPDVRREAQRKQISEEQVLAQREATRVRRLEEQRLQREAVKNFTVDNPRVIETARRNNITPDELVIGRVQAEELRKQVRENAKRTQAEAFGELYRINVPKIRGPRPSDFGEGSSGLYDWFTGLDAREKARLSRSYFQSGSTVTPDQLAQIMEQAGYRFASLDEAMQQWLDITRRYEAAGALSRGRLPSARAYSNSPSVNIRNLAGDVAAEGWDIDRIMSDDLFEAAAHVVTKQGDEITEEALRYLGNAPAARYGPRPYQMQYETWRGEVEDLEFLVRNQVSDMTIEEVGRLAELVPPDLDGPGVSYEELYARIIDTARSARERVIENVDIPWQS